MQNAKVIFVVFFFTILFSFLLFPKSAAAQVVINEVYYDVDSSHGQETSPVNEWIELYNKGNSAVNLSNWTIADNFSTKTIPSGITISGNGLVLISSDATTWNYWSIDSSVTKVVMTIGNGLSNTGDKLILKDSAGTEIDKLSYGANIDVWNPALTDVSEGHSLERVPGGQDADVIADFIDQESPTPGRIVAQAPSPTSSPTLRQSPSPTSSTQTPTPTPVAIKTPTLTPTKTPTPKPTPIKTPTLSPTPESFVLGIESVSPSPSAQAEASSSAKFLGWASNLPILPFIFIILGASVFIGSGVMYFRNLKTGKIERLEVDENNNENQQ